MPGRVEPPLGVKILAVLAGFMAALLVLLSVSGFAFIASELGAVMLVSPFTARGGLAVLAGLLYLAYAVGLWMMEPWAWWIAMILNGVGAVSSLQNLGRMAFGFVVSLAVLVYLYSKRGLFEVKL